MNRKEEYTTLLTELESAPDSLEYTVTRAKARMKKRKHIRRFFVPASSLAAVFAAFILTVNLSTTFALACGRVPVLRDLAAAVDFSPSLSAAVKNKYVQPIGLEQTKNNITMRIEYVIVDQEQLNIFYTLNSDRYKNLSATPKVSNPDGSALDCITESCGDSEFKKGDFYQLVLMFVESKMPSSLNLTCKVQGGAAPATFTFTLNFDPNFIDKGNIINLNQNIMLDGQTLTVSSVDICPTHTNVNLSDNQDNTKWLKSLTCYMENEKGNRFERIHDCATALGREDSPMMGCYRLESSYFSDSKHLTLYITDAILLDKNMKRVKVDLAHGTADDLPNGVTFDGAEKKGSNWEVTFTDHNIAHNPLFSYDYYDESGNKYSYYNYEISADTSNGVWQRFTLTGYQKDVAYLCPDYSDIVTLDTPIAVNVK